MSVRSSLAPCGPGGAKITNHGEIFLPPGMVQLLTFFQLSSSFFITSSEGGTFICLFVCLILPSFPPAFRSRALALVETGFKLLRATCVHYLSGRKWSGHLK